MSEVVQTFTAEIPTWSPYVTPVELASATPEQLAAMKITRRTRACHLTCSRWRMIRSRLRYARRCSTSS